MDLRWRSADSAVVRNLARFANGISRVVKMKIEDGRSPCRTMG